MIYKTLAKMVVILFTPAVPVITHVANPPQPEPKKPKNEHASDHEEQHVLFQPGKTENEHSGHDEENGHDEQNGHNEHNGHDEQNGHDEHVTNPPQPESKKPKNEHASDHEEQHVLFQPRKTSITSKTDMTSMREIARAKVDTLVTSEF
jgi:hypothetical protein